jgi:uncharacterized damage-inducible protein DinB
MDFTLDRTFEILSRTPLILRELLSGLSDDWTHHPYGENTWSAREVVAHLVYCEIEDWIPRARIILEHGDSRAFDPFDRAGHVEPSRGKSLDELLDEFEDLRRRNLALVRSWNLTDLDRRGRHPALGPVTLRNLLATWAVHDLNHIAQVCKAMAHQYREAAGPWEKYLSILSPPNPR